MKKKTIITIVILAAVVVVFAAIKMNPFSKNDAKIEFNTVVVKRGKISNTVSATGTLEAIETVEVGTQVSGVIDKLYVDFNSDVKKGQLLAEIDKRPLKMALNQSKATLDEAQAELNYQQATYDRNKALFEKKLIAEADYDQVIYNYEQAKANLKNAQSNYDRSLINLNYATITSPIDGVVLNRAVQQGQTVAASFNTPTLFSIANDLTQMQVQASVDEADIGQVKDGQHVEFTVDAYPDLKFPGTVSQVRLQPVVTSNVVTYTVIINAPNPDKKLMPGMTATSTIYVQQANDDLLIPMQAAKFQPDQQMLQAYYAGRNGGHKMDSARTNRRGQWHGMRNDSTAVSGADNGEGTDVERIWILKDGRLFPRRIKVDISDGINYGIKSGLNEGDSVVLAMTQAGGAAQYQSGGSRSPFLPNFRRRSNNNNSSRGR